MPVVQHPKRGIALKFQNSRSTGVGRWAAFLAVLGPGILAGLSDDDPAGITTYYHPGHNTCTVDKKITVANLCWERVDVAAVALQPLAGNSVVSLPDLPLIPLIYSSQVVNAVMLPLHVVACVLALIFSMFSTP